MQSRRGIWFPSLQIRMPIRNVLILKTGATADNEIDAISGATITTNAVTNGVNAGLALFRDDAAARMQGTVSEQMK